MAVETISEARPVLEDGSMDINSLPIKLETGPSLFPEWFYGVVDKDDFLHQSFETIEECKQYIDEETE